MSQFFTYIVSNSYTLNKNFIRNHITIENITLHLNNKRNNLKCLELINMYCVSQILSYKCYKKYS